MKKVKLSVLSVLFLVGVLSIAGAQESSINFKPYGFIKLDMAYDQARTNNGNYVFWVNPGSGNESNSEFNMTARQTRLGFNISYDELDDKVVTARFEFDFIMNIRHPCAVFPPYRLLLCLSLNQVQVCLSTSQDK